MKGEKNEYTPGVVVVEEKRRRDEIKREELLRQWHRDTMGDDITAKSRAEARLGLQIRLREVKSSRNETRAARDKCKEARDQEGLDKARKMLKKHGYRYSGFLQEARDGMSPKTEVNMRKVWVSNPLSLEQFLANVALDGIAEFMDPTQLCPNRVETEGADDESMDISNSPSSNLFSGADFQDADGPAIESVAWNEFTNEDQTLQAFEQGHHHYHEADMTEHHTKPRPAIEESDFILQNFHGHDIKVDTGENDIASVNAAFEDMDFLLPSKSRDHGDQSFQASRDAFRIQQAPLVGAGIISGNPQNLLPQYGLVASHKEAGPTGSKIFLNTNVPFSMFLCGVQGSGKSHTMSCILENSLVPSKHLGVLRQPLSALVFSYGQFSGDGIGFSVSEAAFLASADPRLPGSTHVKQVHVLVSPSNYVRMAKLYQKLPNTSITPFKIKPLNLNIDTMLTLMNVSESDETPLYMAQVMQILREMSTAGGPFNYKAFKLHLRKQKFNPTQTSMLKMRLDLLESFLDVDNTCIEPQFRPGEITIMDMSCPFVDANTACILFRLGLQQYLQSGGTGKMIVLDEAHKVMTCNKF